MDWSKQAETMMQTWTEAQKKMWESWYDMAQGASVPGTMPLPFFPDAMKQWQEMAAQSFNAWMQGAEPTARNTARQMMASQETMMRFLQTTAQAWQAIAPKIQTGEDWRSVLDDYGSQWFQNMFGVPAGMMSVSKDTNELWQFYMQEWQKLSQPWLQMGLQSPGNLGHLMMGGGTELAQLTKFHWDVYERTFGGVTEVPGLGYNRELNQKLLSGFDSWVDLQKASAEYHAILSKTFGQAFEKFMAELVSLSEKGETIDSIQNLINLWFDTIDKSFTTMYVSDEYLEIQKNLAAAAMTNKMQQQKVFEVMLDMFDLPTRSELDDAYRALNDLRREVRALKKAMKAQDSGATPAKKTTRKSSSRSASKKTTAKQSNETTKPEAEAAVSG